MAKTLVGKKKKVSAVGRVIEAVTGLVARKKATTAKAKANPKKKPKPKANAGTAAAKSATTSRVKAKIKATKGRGIKRQPATKTPAATARTTSTKKPSYAETLATLARQNKTHAGPDPAHAPGHRRLRLDGSSVHVGGKNTPQNASAENTNTRADIIHKTESPQRRLIPGASIERKGRRG